MSSQLSCFYVEIQGAQDRLAFLYDFVYNDRLNVRAHEHGREGAEAGSQHASAEPGVEMTPQKGTQRASEKQTGAYLYKPGELTRSMEGMYAQELMEIGKIEKVLQRKTARRVSEGDYGHVSLSQDTSAARMSMSHAHAEDLSSSSSSSSSRGEKKKSKRQPSHAVTDGIEEIPYEYSFVDESIGLRTHMPLREENAESKEYDWAKPDAKDRPNDVPMSLWVSCMDMYQVTYPLVRVRARRSLRSEVLQVVRMGTLIHSDRQTNHWIRVFAIEEKHGAPKFKGKTVDKVQGANPRTDDPDAKGNSGSKNDGGIVVVGGWMLKSDHKHGQLVAPLRKAKFDDVHYRPVASFTVRNGKLVDPKVEKQAAQANSNTPFTTPILTGSVGLPARIDVQTMETHKGDPHPPPPLIGWEVYFDPSTNRNYYYNLRDGAVQWENPMSAMS